MDISVIIPCYNEEKNIFKTLSVLESFLGEHFLSFEIIVSDDGSKDKTKSEVMRFMGANKGNNLVFLSSSKNFGKGAAVKKGILKASGNLVFFTDADLSYSPINLLSAARQMKEKKLDCLFGKRINLKKDYPLSRRFPSFVFSNLSALLKIEASDPQCGFKGFSGSAAKRIFTQVSEKGFAFDLEVAYISKKLDLSTEEIPLRFYHRENSKIRLIKDSFELFETLLKLKFRGI